MNVPVKQLTEQNMTLILDSLSVYAAYIDAKTLSYLFVNNLFAKTFNLPREDIIGSHMQNILPKANFAYALPYIKTVLKGQAVSYEYYFKVAVGLRWIKIDYTPQFDTQGHVVAFITMGTDITEQKQAEATLKKSETYYRFIVETASEGIMILDKNLNIEYINNKLEVILGYEKGSLTGQNSMSLVFEKDFDTFNRRIKKRTQGKSGTYEKLLKAKNGLGHWSKISAKPIMDEDSTFQGIFVMITDIHSRKLLEKKLEQAIKKLKRLSTTDELTGLANRRFFNKNTFNYYKKWRNQQNTLCFIMLDIDYFKELNDYYGHVYGDLCLKKIARVLAKNINGPTDIVSRYGGDEFLCLVAEQNPEELEILATKLLGAVEKLKIEHSKSEISSHVTISLGLAIITCPTKSELTDYIKYADNALYEAKKSGRNKFAIFTYTSPLA